MPDLWQRRMEVARAVLNPGSGFKQSGMNSMKREQTRRRLLGRHSSAW